MRALALVVFVVAAAGLAACSDGATHGCACTVTVESQSLQLGCGETGCVGGSSFGCAEDGVEHLGPCVPRDASDADALVCLASQAACDPAAQGCCGSAVDAGAPSCDPVSRRCCVAAGGACAGSAECCSGHACIVAGAGQVCGG